MTRIRQTRLHLLLAAGIAWTGAPLIGQKAALADTTGPVNCYDAARQMVSSTRRDDCRGKIVSDAQAAQIRQQRQARVKDALAINVGPSALGKRLAGVGSGFFIDRQGHLLTNAHVVKGCTTLTASRPEGRMQPAKLEELDLSLDLALVETGFRPTGNARFAPINASPLGQVAILGYPGGGTAAGRPTLTMGAIATAGQPTPVPGLLVLKADVRPGNSGGPVLDEHGRVLGVVFAAVDTKRFLASTGQLVQDIGYAIPNRSAQRFLKRNRIHFQTSESRATDSSKKAIDAAEGYMARIECWL